MNSHSSGQNDARVALSLLDVSGVFGRRAKRGFALCHSHKFDLHVFVLSSASQQKPQFFLPFPPVSISL